MQKVLTCNYDLDMLDIYFDNSTKLFSDLYLTKFSDSLAKLFFLCIFEDYTTATITHTPRFQTRLDSTKESFSMETPIPTRFIPPSVKKVSHIPLEIANICGSISNR